MPDCVGGVVVPFSDFPFLRSRREITGVSSWADSYDREFWHLMHEVGKTQGSESWLFKRTVAAMIHRDQTGHRDICQDENGGLPARWSFSIVATALVGNDLLVAGLTCASSYFGGYNRNFFGQRRVISPSKF